MIVNADARKIEEKIAPTPAQSRCLAVIREYVERNSCAPTFEEICGFTGLAMGTVAKHIDGLEARGWISRTPRRMRSIVLTDHCPACGRPLK